MDRNKTRLIICIVILFSVIAYVSVGFGTLHHVEVTYDFTEPKISLLINYGMFRYCVTPTINHTVGGETCKDIDYGNLGPANAIKYYDNDSEIECDVAIVAYAVGILAALISVYGLFARVTEKFFLEVFGAFGAAGIVGVVTISLYTNELMATWSLFDNPPNIPYPVFVTSSWSWSYYIYVTGSALMVIAGIIGVILTHGWDEYRRTH